MNINDYVNSILKSTKESKTGIEFDMRFDIVDFIKRKLSETDMSQKKLALMMNMKESQLTRILNAESNMTLETVARIFHAFDGRPTIIEKQSIPDVVSEDRIYIHQSVISQPSRYLKNLIATTN